MQIKRFYTESGKDPLSSFKFEKRTSEIRNPDGSIVFRMEDIVVPSQWSQVATDIIAQKYFRKAGVPKLLKRIREKGVPSWLQSSRADVEKLELLPEKERYSSEVDSRQVFHRLAGCWTYWGWQGKYFGSEEDAKVFYDELVYMLANQMSAPNSPQWFNTGLNWAYGISGPSQGHYYVDHKTGELTASSDAYTHPQPHACFIQSVSDDLVNEGGIMDLWVREARLFKYGSGTGSNFSDVRGSSEPLSGGGRSSCLMSFLKIGDRAAGAIKSGGTTRRAAKMVTIDMDHPDIEEFINWKVIEEQKVASLVAGSRLCNYHLNAIMKACYDEHPENDRFSKTLNKKLRNAVIEARKVNIHNNYIERVIQLAKLGFKSIEFPIYSTDWNSDSYSTVSGQNSNNSIRVTNEFMNAILNDGEWNLYWRVEKKKAAQENRQPKPYRTLKANALWDDIAFAAWSCADPGIQFHTTINEWHTCPENGEIRASNPCSEYMFLDDTACNLASLNLVKFYDNQTKGFKVDSLRHATRIWTIVLEISVLMAQFPSKAIAQNSYDFRTLGLGYANLGTMLMVSGIPYDSEKARSITASLTAILTGESYATSAELASHIGAFPEYENNKEFMLRVIRNHKRAAYGVPVDKEAEAQFGAYEGLEIKPIPLNPEFCPADLLSAARSSWDKALRLGEEYGFRNAQTTVIAPTGTIGLLMDCDTTGVEPDFALVKFKKLAGGGYWKMPNQSIKPALLTLGYSKNQISDIITYVVGCNSLDNQSTINRETLFKKGLTKETLEKIEHELQRVFQLHYAFTKYTLRDNVLALNDSNSNFLDALGFTEEEQRNANNIICGHHTIEGAPHLKSEHLKIFDCANICGNGVRFIDPMGHVKMLAVTQPFISGSISKTINMPGSASVEDIEKVYLESWRLGLKAVALYRDGSKLSQPLSTKQKEEKTPTLLIEKPPTQLSFIERGTKRELPQRRKGITIYSNVAGHKIFLSTRH